MSNTFVITGIPRSGTTLLCNLVNKVSNVVCFNEVGPAYDVPKLPSFFINMRNRILNGMLVPMDVDSSGELITDTQVQTDHSHELYRIDVDSSKQMFLGSKINYPYLSQIQVIKEFGYDIFAVVRDPVYAIASWNRHRRNINEAHVMPEDWADGRSWLRYSQTPFRANDMYGRQAEVWNMQAGMILRNIEWDRILKYEDLVDQTSYRLMHFCSQLGAEYDIADLPVLDNHNTISMKSEYQAFMISQAEFDGITNAVRKYAPLALELGYRV